MSDSEKLESLAGEELHSVVMPFAGIGDRLAPEARGRFIADIIDVVNTVKKKLESDGIDLEHSLKQLTNVGKLFLATKGLEPLVDIAQRINSAEVERMQKWAAARREATSAALVEAKARAIEKLSLLLESCIVGRLSASKRERAELIIRALEVFSRGP